MGIVVIDRAQIEGKSLRQLADLAAMHLLLDVRLEAGKRNKNSILSLFEGRREGVLPPRRTSTLDRGAVAGLFGQEENNRTAAQQRQNIARVIEKERQAEAKLNSRSASRCVEWVMHFVSKSTRLKRISPDRRRDGAAS